jgi:hypothetical protein
VKHAKEHRFQADILRLKIALNATYSNASSIKVTLTTIPDLYLMDKDPLSSRNRLMW